MSMKADALEKALGKYIDFRTETGGMAGYLWLIYEDEGGTEWAVIDCGYGVRIEAVTGWDVIDPAPPEAGLPMWADDPPRRERRERRSA